MFLIDQQTDLLNRHLLFQDYKIKSLNLINASNISGKVVYNLTYAFSTYREE